MSDFLSHYVPDSPGEIVDLEGRVLGHHRGLHLYTLGQRKGHGVASPREGMAYVVVGKDPALNRLILGWDQSETPGLYASHCLVGSLSWVNGEPENHQIDAQPRYRAKAEPVRIQRREEKLEVHFHRPQRALTPGQICAFYEGGRLLGGGVFEQITSSVADSAP